MRITTSIESPFSTLKFERKIIKNKKDKFFEILLYLFCFFPFVKWIRMLYFGNDTQPYAMVFAFFIIVFYIREEMNVGRKEKGLILLSILMGGLALMSIPEKGIGGVTSPFATYLSLAIIPLAIFWLCKRCNGLNESLVKTFIWIWFVVGAIQMMVDKNFGMTILARATTNSKRGVVSLGTEPSAYGYMCLFMLLLALDFKKFSKAYVLLLLVQIVAMAGSSVTMIYLAVYVMGIAINDILQHKKFAVLRVLALAVGGFGSLYVVYIKNMLPTRMQELAGYLVTGNWMMIWKDASIQQRISAIEDAIASFVNFYGIPQGFTGSRVMSGVGILLIECGILAFVYLGIIGKIIWDAYPKEIRFVMVFGFMITMISAIPFSSPMVCFYIGYCLYKGWMRKNGDRVNKIENTLGL